ncbi:MAG: autotransporter domain-containing protein [Alphaproteobacteria bacterium]|nr:autotransporter domain-containing protein [Alphaproteobacteria bacterium]
MSNTKHLADLLKVCSILPALAIMPAMAGENIVTGDASLSYPDVEISHTTTGTDNALGVDAQGKATIDFNGDITNIAVNAEGNAEYSAAVFNRNSKGTVLNFNTDKTILSATGSSNSVLGVRVNGNGSVVNLNGETEINVSSDSTKMLRAIDVTDGGYVSLNDDTVLNLTGGKDAAETIGILSSGAKSVDLAQGKDLAINASGVREVYGLYAQYGGAINMAQDTEVDIHSTATDGDAYGVVSGYYSNATGTIDSKGEIDIDVSGDNAYGLMNFGGASTHIADLDIVATAQQIARGIWVTDDKVADESKAETTDVVIGSEGSTTEIIAKGGDTKNTAGIWAEKLEEDVGLTVLGDVDIKSDGFGVVAKGGAVANIGTEYAKEIKIVSESGRTLRAEYGSVLNVGNAKTETVDITTGNNYAVMAMYQESKVGISGKSINIANNATGVGAVHAGVNDMLEREYEQLAAVSIEGDNIVITNDAVAGNGVSAMSQGIVDIIGNTTIKADNAILARGKSYVNINTSGENTVKMLGDIDFDYDKDTSGSSIDAYIDVTLAGAESFWTGNTVVSYGSGKPEDESLLVVSNAKLTMKDGAVWNATKITDSKEDVEGRYYTALNDLVIDDGTVNIADTERGITIDRIVANDATFNGGMLNVNETIAVNSGFTTFAGNVLGGTGATLTLANGATMDIGTSAITFDNMEIDGTIIASVVNSESYGRLSGAIDAGDDALLKLNVGSVGTYKIFDTETDMDVDAGLAYIVTNNGLDGIVVETKAVEDIATDAGISTQTAGAIAGLANSESSKAQQVSLALQEVLNNGDVELLEQETAKLTPTDKPMVQSTVASIQNTVSALASNRMSSVASIGRSGGDVDVMAAGVWAQGLYNKTKLDGQFNGYTRGIAAGMDGIINGDITVGVGYAFNNSDVALASRDTDIDSHSVFVYGQYKPAAWYVNAMLNYTMSDYAETGDTLGIALAADYKTNAFGGQITAGYDFEGGITPEFGVRYLHINSADYTNSIGIKNELDSADYLTAVLGTRYGFDFETDNGLMLRPEVHYAVKYDMISDKSSATVAMPGVAAYTLDGERLSRVGAEFGMGLTMKYNELDVSLSYDIEVREDYTSQTGMLKARYNF